LKEKLAFTAMCGSWSAAVLGALRRLFFMTWRWREAAAAALRCCPRSSHTRSSSSHSCSLVSPEQTRARLLWRRGERRRLRYAARLRPQRGTQGGCDATTQPAHPPARDVADRWERAPAVRGPATVFQVVRLSDRLFAVCQRWCALRLVPGLPAPQAHGEASPNAMQLQLCSWPCGHLSLKVSMGCRAMHASSPLAPPMLLFYLQSAS